MITNDVAVVVTQHWQSNTSQNREPDCAACFAENQLLEPRTASEVRRSQGRSRLLRRRYGFGDLGRVRPVERKAAERRCNPKLTCEVIVLLIIVRQSKFD